MKQEELKEILSQHQLWLDKILEQHQLWLDTDGKEGKQADLSAEDLSGLNFRGADLRYSKIKGADFESANCENVDFRHSDLRFSCLAAARIKNADFRHSDITHTDFSDFCGLYSAKFEGAKILNHYKLVKE
jgi:uncharacterized protein YjbI with pentapeptide repeats